MEVMLPVADAQLLAGVWQMAIDDDVLANEEGRESA